MNLNSRKRQSPPPCRWGFVVLVCGLGAVGCRNIGDRPVLPVFCRDLPPDVAPSEAMPEFTLVAAAQPPELPSPKTADMPLQRNLADSILPTCFSGEQPADLSALLGQGEGANPIIALSEEVVRANLAELTAARALLYPTLNAGMTLSMHRGPLQSGSGSIVDVQRQSLYLGGGADVRGAGTLAVPAVRIVGNLSDAYFAPKIAERRVASSRFDSAGVRNRTLLEIAQAYLALTGAESRLLAYRQSESEFAEIVRITGDFAKRGFGLDADAKRAQSELLLLQVESLPVESDLIVANAELSRLARTDPTLRLRPPPGTPPIFHLVDDNMPLDALIDLAVSQRPEIAARSTDVAVAQTVLRQERVRPFVPTISLGASAGDFGGGSNMQTYRFSHFGSRGDVDLMAVWTLDNLGFGNRAVQNRARAQIGEAEARRLATIDIVRGEVAEAYVVVRSERVAVAIAKRRIGTSEAAYQQDLVRARNGEGRPIEVLKSAKDLSLARQDLISAMSQFSQAEFGLFTAIGGMPYAPSPSAGSP